MFISNSLTGNLISSLLFITIIAILYCKWLFQHWQRRNLPYLTPEIPYGNIRSALKGKEHIAVSLKHIYNEMKTRKWKHGGIFLFTKPSYFPIDLNIIKNIMTKDFQHFMDRDVFYNEKDPLQAHLLNLSGHKWRNLRAKLTPTFTSGKIKNMFSVMVECQSDLLKRMDTECANNEPINIKEVLACFTTNVIGSCAFGIDCQALEDEDSAFRTIGKKMFSSTKWLRWKRTIWNTFPKVAKFFNLSLRRPEVADFITKVVQDTIDYREKNNYTRNDFMQLMINLKNDKPDQALTFDEVASQCIVFFAAGFETSSTLMTFALYELAKAPEVQEKLREEIINVLSKHNNEITYDSVQDISYLNQVIDETLRLHPPGALINRKCVQDYQIPNENFVIEKDTNVTISILGIHHDEDYYPDPAKFDPQRFTEENKKTRHNFTHIPFGEGPRNCIGMRFGLLQSKVGIVSLLRNYKFTLSTKTQEPIVYEPSSIVLSVKGDVWLKAQKI